MWEKLTRDSIRGSRYKRQRERETEEIESRRKEKGNP